MTPREMLAGTGIPRRLRAAAEFRRRAELAVVERLNPSVSIESLPLVILIAVLATLCSMRRH
jgi:hypothetical protein